MIRIGFGDILYYNYNKEPQNPILVIKALHYKACERDDKASFIRS